MGEDDLVICRCEEVTRQEIETAIETGARTVRGVKIRTRAGMGLCQGKTCSQLVAKILAEKTNQKPHMVPPGTARPPIRVLKAGSLAGKVE
jgi:NAD(P)H-nitrite reductase large subunit